MGHRLLAVVAGAVLAIASTEHLRAECPPKTLVYFGNGIDTRWDAADDARRELDAAVENKVSVAEWNALEFYVSYNPTQGRTPDLIESAEQVLAGGSEWKLFWHNLFNYGPLVAGPQGIAQLLFNGYASLNDVDYQPTLDKHIDTYRRAITQQGAHVIVVAHSQGNFFANEATSGLTEDERSVFSIVSVANPDSKVEIMRVPHTTLIEDQLIQRISEKRFLAGLGRSMEPNVTNLPSISTDSSGHSFLNSYMQKGYAPDAPRISRERIVDFIVDTMRWGCGRGSIDFESLPDGRPTVFSEPVRDAYRSVGVVFSTNDQADISDPFFGNFSGHAASTIVQEFGRSPTGTFNIVVEFLSPMESVSAEVYAALGFSVTMTAKDAFGTVLGTTTSSASAASFRKGTLSLSAIGSISRVEWEASNPIVSSVGIDNLTFFEVRSFLPALE